MGMRRVGVLVVVTLLAGCSHSHSSGIDKGAPGSWRTVQQMAASLCEHAKPGSAHLAASFPTTIADFRSTTIGTIGPAQTHRFSGLAASADGAWCWTGRAGAYAVYEVAADGRKQLVVSGALTLTPDGHPDAN